MPLGLVESCSNNGHLVNGSCICNQGWTSIGDFNPTKGLDCGIDEASVQILASISLALGLIAMIIFFRYLLVRLIINPKFDINMKFVLTYTIQTVTCNIYDIAVIINPEDSVFGQSVYITVLMGIAYGTAYGKYPAIDTFTYLYYIEFWCHQNIKNRLNY